MLWAVWRVKADANDTKAHTQLDDSRVGESPLEGRALYRLCFSVCHFVKEELLCHNEAESQAVFL